MTAGKIVLVRLSALQEEREGDERRSCVHRLSNFNTHWEQKRESSRRVSTNAHK